MLKTKISDKGLIFSVMTNGHDIHFKEWSATDDCIYYLPLAMLVDNGFADYKQHECLVPFDSIYMLDDDDQKILGIPKPYSMALRLRGLGMLNTPEFQYQLDYLTSVPDGELLQCERCGNIVFVNGKQYLLRKEQYHLVSKVEDFNNQQDKSTESNLLQFADIKESAKSAGCQLDSYLENENVYAPQKLKIDVEKNEDGFDIKPSLDIDDKGKFSSVFDKMRRVANVYPVQNENGERTRIVINNAQKADLDKLKKAGKKHRTRQEIRELAEHPTQYFDPEVFDLTELYSDRVIEIGLYQPKFYGFICPYKSCWIAGATIETPENGTTKVTIKDEEELEQLRKAIADAKESGKDIVEFADTQIGIEDSEFLLDTAEKQLKSPTAPLRVERAGKQVLIIEENAEELGFSTTNTTIEQGERYTLFKDSFLNPSFCLKAHQEEGVAWLQYLYKGKASGCLMADDMGLGKTLQILYFIDWHSRNFPNHRPYLIVAPISLLENWENEYCRFFDEPRMSVTRLSSRDVPRQFNREVVERMQKLDIILTNYESLRNSQMNFCAVEFDVVALDEAQKIKTPGTLVTNAAKALKAHFKIAMTGTPVENTLLDLWSIMDFCVPGLLGNAKSFAAHYQNPMKKEDTDIVALGNEVHEKLGLYFMRRLKKDAAKDLPQKHEFKEQVRMPSLQENTYRSVVNEYVQGIQPNILQTIMQIREISEHPFLYDDTIAEHDAPELIDNSARLQATIVFLDRIKAKEEKVILFAERKESQKMLQRLCIEKYGLVPKIINGDTPTVVSQLTGNRLSRQASIDDFQNTDGFNVIIMSPIAAGMGLNVTAANHIIHYSRHWNPAKENQATDRAYRIGQTKDVFVYYPMAVSDKFQSFDITLDQLLGRKTSLATSTIFPTERIEVTQAELGEMLFGK